MKIKWGGACEHLEEYLAQGRYRLSSLFLLPLSGANHALLSLPRCPPVWDLVPPPITIKGILGNRFDQVTPLLKTSWRLPITLTINFQFLNMAYKVLHDLARTLLPSPHLKPSPTLVGPALLSLQLSARHRLLWEDRLSLPGLRTPRPLLVQQPHHWAWHCILTVSLWSMSSASFYMYCFIFFYCHTIRLWGLWEQRLHLVHPWIPRT